MSDELRLADCQQFEERLNELLDRRLSFADDVLLCEHARGCPSCNELWHDYLQILGSTQSSPTTSATGLKSSVGTINTMACETISVAEIRSSHRFARAKFLMSLAPSIAALMIVAVSMLIETQSPTIQFASPGSHLRGMQGVVAQAELGSDGSCLSKMDSMDESQPTYELLADSLMIQDGIVGGVTTYSTAFYRLANDHSPLQTYQLMQHGVSQVALPHEPIHQRLPYRGEFSTIPQLRFFLGFAVQLVRQAFPDALPGMEPGLGLFLESWDYRKRLT